MIELPPREAYRLWAPVYERETAVSFLDDQLVAKLTPPLDRLRLLDAGCGTGRRLDRCNAALAVGVDLTPEMLAAGSARTRLAAADAAHLPFGDAVFDVVWCRLMIGHVSHPGPVYAELARVCSPGGLVVVTDFHPDAWAAGHRRTFRDATGRLRGVEHHVHDLAAHLASARAAGLAPATRRTGRVGASLLPFYARANRLDDFERQRHLPLVLALSYRRAPMPHHPSPELGRGAASASEPG